MTSSEKHCFFCKKDFPENEEMIIGKCNHGSCCSKCLVNYITKNLQAKIKCPIATCYKNVFDPIIRKCLSTEQTNLYDTLSISGGSNKAKKCPMKDCPFMYMCDGDQGIFICEYCNAPICIKCDRNHYPGECDKNELNETVHNQAKETIINKRRKEFLEMDSLYNLWPNPYTYECTFCTDFILPKKGVILRNCQHCFCETCLKDTYKQKNYISQFKCQICNVKLDNRELRAFIDEKIFVSMVIKEASLLMYHCKSANCPGFWHVSTDAVSHTCPSCQSVNCLKCNDIHKGMSCQEFKLTDISINIQKEMENLMLEAHVNCRHCHSLLIQNGGCGAIHCDICGHHTCVFTGLFAGKHDPKKCGCLTYGVCQHKDKYCECSTKNPCDTKCEFGCFPE